MVDTLAPPRRRELLAATVGTVVEIYDWSVYGVLAPFFAGQVFAGGSPVASLLGAYVGFAIGFAMRPLGSWLIGRIADRRGRRLGLTLSVGGVAVGCLVLAVVPTFGQVGVLSAVIVVAARLVQGLTLGAEGPTAAAYVTETAPPDRRYRYSAISFGGGILGTLIGFVVLTVLLAVLGPDGVRDGGWRIGFAIGALLGFVALWIRLRAPESDEFQAGKPGPRNWRGFLIVFGLNIGGTVAFYFGSVYLPVYAQNVGALDVAGASATIPVALVVMLVAMVAAGVIADRVGPLMVLRLGFLLLAVLTVPLMLALSTRTLPVLVVAVLFLLCFAVPSAVISVVSGRLFRASGRATGIGVPNALSIGLFGGTFPLLSQALAGAGRIELVPWLVAAAAAVSLATAVLLRPADVEGA
jgi:MHS family alpha-ketoglutarate permease-like MFS transporter